MQVGISCVAEDIDAFRARVRRVDSAGFDRLGVGDSPAFGDVHTTLGIAAEHSRRVHLGPLVTNPLTRWPSVTAGAMRTLDRATGGRTFLGLGAGDSAVRASGRGMSTIRTLAKAVEHLREAGVGRPSGPPLALAANGPRALKLAGRVADEVLYGSSLLCSDLAAARRHVLAGASQAGRDSPPAFWAVVRGWVAEDPEREASARDTLLASAANHAFARRIPDDLPPDVVARVRTLLRRYDFAAHGQPGPNANAALVQALDLRGVLAPRFGWVATADQFRARLAALATCGVEGVVIPAVGDAPDLLIDRLATDVLESPAEGHSPPRGRADHR